MSATHSARMWWEKVSNEEVRKITGMGLLSAIIRKRRLQWLGHVERMAEERMPRVLFDGRLKGNKKAFVGVRKRWVNLIRKDAETAGVSVDQIPELTSDRAKWKDFVKHAAALEPPAVKKRP